MGNDSPWQEEVVLRELYVEKQMSAEEIADELGCGTTTIFRWMDRHGIERRTLSDAHLSNTEDFLRDEERLERLYVDEGKSIGEIADEKGVSPNTVHRWLKEHDIEIRGKFEDKRKKPAPYRIDHHGYCEWKTETRGEVQYVRVHRLLAVAEYGFNAVCDKHVHHKNGLRWDNRPENIELMTPKEHSRHHIEENEIWNESPIINS